MVFSSLTHSECGDCERRVNERSSGRFSSNRTDSIITIVTRPVAAGRAPRSPSTLIIITDYNDRLNCSAILIILKRNEHQHSSHIRDRTSRSTRAHRCVVFHFNFNFFFSFQSIHISRSSASVCAPQRWVSLKNVVIYVFFFVSCVSNIYINILL